MTKAERIFKATYTEARLHVKKWGYNPETDRGFTEVYTGTETEDNPEGELVYRRTMNQLEALLKKEKDSLAHDIKLGFLSEERTELLKNALLMVERTLEDQYIA